MATPRNPLAAFIWGAGGAALTPEEIARRREVEDALLAKEGIDTSPVGHWTQGLARVANAAVGAYRRNKLEGAQTDNDTYNKSLVETLLGRSGTPASSGAVPGGEASAELASTDPASGVVATGPQSYRDAIASIESAGSGDYAAVGPTHKTMGRALGRYQIMESNIAPWAKEALGREVTADEFMADPAIQDAIFDNQFGKYIQKYGPEGAAQAWFGGEGGVGKTGRKDVLGTTIGGYGQKFLKALGQQEVASIDPAAGVEVLPADGTMPLEGASLADEVAQFEQTPEYAAQFGQPTADAQLTGRDAVAKALMDQQSVDPAQVPITDQTAALPTTDAAQAAVTGAQPVEMAQATTGQQGLSGIPTEELLRVLTDPRANANTRAVAQALMQQQEAARRQQVEQETWMARQRYEEQRQAQDPLRRLQIEEGQLKVDALRNPAEKVPDSVQALELRAERAGLVKGTPEYSRFMLSGGDKGITINNEGNIPAGYQANRDAEGRIVSISPIAGSPAALEQKQVQEARDRQAGRRETATDVITTAASEARNILNNERYTTGTMGRLASTFTESGAAELRRQIDVLKANATIENLTAMRQASPTGAALGSVTQEENKMLASAAGSIDPDAGYDRVKKALDNYERTMLRVIHGPKVGDAIFEQTRQPEDIDRPEDVSPEDWEFMTPEERRLFQ